MLTYPLNWSLRCLESLTGVELIHGLEVDICFVEEHKLFQVARINSTATLVYQIHALSDFGDHSHVTVSEFSGLFLLVDGSFLLSNLSGVLPWVRIAGLMAFWTLTTTCHCDWCVLVAWAFCLSSFKGSHLGQFFLGRFSADRWLARIVRDSILMVWFVLLWLLRFGWSGLFGLRHVDFDCHVVKEALRFQILASVWLSRSLLRWLAFFLKHCLILSVESSIMNSVQSLFSGLSFPHIWE